MPLRDRLKQHARETSEARAAVIGDRSVTYGALAARANRLDTFISACPRVPRAQNALGDVPVFGLLMGNHPQVIEFLVTALAGRCCVVLLDPLLPDHQLFDILDRLPPDVLFTAGQAVERFQGRGFPVISIESDDDLEILIADTPETEMPAPRDENPFLIAFTSGTTSRPKAFARTRRSWRKSLMAGRAHFGVGPNLHTLSPGPLAHGLSLYAFVETLDAGATFHSLDRFTAGHAWSTLANNGLARLVCVPSVLDALCRHDAVGRDPLNKLLQVTTSGAKLNDGLLDQLWQIAPNAAVTEYYGASELGFVTTVSHWPGQSGYARGGSGVGRAFPGVDIEIRPFGNRNRQDGIGTIWVRGDLMIDGYLWQDDHLAFQRDGNWATVGDIGRFDAAGDLELISRANGMVISGGNNVYPEEINTCLRGHPAIKEACVLGVPDSYLGKALIAVIKFETNSTAPALDELISFCRLNVQKYKVPRQFFTVAEWPMTSSGKISTGRLEEWIMEKDDRLVLL